MLNLEVKSLGTLGILEIKQKSQEQNNAKFNHLKLKKWIHWFFWKMSWRNFNIDFYVNNHVKLYKMAVDYYKSIYSSKPFHSLMMTLNIVSTLSLWCYSKQIWPIDIRINTSLFIEVIPVTSECYVYALILSDKWITLESDGNKKRLFCKTSVKVIFYLFYLTKRV